MFTGKSKLPSENKFLHFFLLEEGWFTACMIRTPGLPPDRLARVPRVVVTRACPLNGSLGLPVRFGLRPLRPSTPAPVIGNGLAQWGRPWCSISFWEEHASLVRPFHDVNNIFLGWWVCAGLLWWCAPVSLPLSFVHCPALRLSSRFG